MDDLQRIIEMGGFAVILGAFVAGVMIRIAGGILRRPFWRAGVRLYAGAMAGLPSVGGLFLLATPFWRLGDAWWLDFLTAPIGVLSVILGIAFATP